MPTDNYRPTAKAQVITAKPFDLEERTLLYAQSTRAFVKKLPKTIANYEDGRQLIRSSGSVGANYIEAREALSPKDHLHRLRISRKEAKESIFWYQLVDMNGDTELDAQRQALLQESRELMFILSSVIEKKEKKD